MSQLTPTFSFNRTYDRYCTYEHTRVSNPNKEKLGTLEKVFESGFLPGDVWLGTVDTEMPFLWSDSSVTFTHINTFPDAWASNANKRCHILIALHLVWWLTEDERVEKLWKCLRL